MTMTLRPYLAPLAITSAAGYDTVGYARDWALDDRERLAADLSMADRVADLDRYIVRLDRMMQVWRDLLAAELAEHGI